MFLPFITERAQKRNLYRRKGGGKGGGGGGPRGAGGSSSSGRSGGSGGSGSSGSSGSTSGSSGGGGIGGSARSSPVSTTSGSRSAWTYSAGGGPSTPIPAGHAFAGRSEGGGTRDQVYGTSTYGSGYPGSTATRGVAGAGFPFYFWPLAWGGAAGVGGGAYLHNSEYGRYDNSSRPGGVQHVAQFDSTNGVSTFFLVADQTSLATLFEDINEGCKHSNLRSSNKFPFNDTEPRTPKPESTIQYYRASSVALTLQGYNNTAALSDNESESPTNLPDSVDRTLMDCLNITIGEAVPLIENGSASNLAFTQQSMPGLAGLLLVLFWVAL